MELQTNQYKPLFRRSGLSRLAVGCWLVFVVLFLVLPTGSAVGSCGNHLHPQASLSVDLDGLSNSNPVPGHRPEGKCKNGNCGSSTPASVPNRDKVQVEDRSQEITLSCALAVSGNSCKGLDVESLTMIQQTYLEVAVPPPKAE